MPQSDSSFLDLLNQKDPAAFEELFRSHFTGLMRYAERILGDTEQAREIAQELFLHLWAKESPFPLSGSLKSYLFTAIHNRCLNHLRHLKVREQHQEFVRTQWDQNPISTYFPDPFLEAKITHAIEELPDQCRRVFRMSRYQFLKNAEIAVELGISVKAVEKQIGRALKYLRESLKDYLPIVLMLAVGLGG